MWSKGKLTLLELKMSVFSFPPTLVFLVLRLWDLHYWCPDSSEWTELHHWLSGSPVCRQQIVGLLGCHDLVSKFSQKVSYLSRYLSIYIIFVLFLWRTLANTLGMRTFCIACVCLLQGNRYFRPYNRVITENKNIHDKIFSLNCWEKYMPQEIYFLALIRVELKVELQSKIF